jgi:hypothetical protein
MIASSSIGLRNCLKSQRESQTIPIEYYNHRKIQYFCRPLGGKLLPEPFFNEPAKAYRRVLGGQSESHPWFQLSNGH